MQFSRVIAQIIELAQAARKELEDWEEKYSLWGRGPDDEGNYPVTAVVPATVVLPKWNPRPAHDALYEFLLDQPVAVNYALAVLTAVGRGERGITDFEVMYDDERRRHGRLKSALRYVAEKVHLAEHLKQGLALLADEDQDVATFLSFVMPQEEPTSRADETVVDGSNRLPCGAPFCRPAAESDRPATDRNGRDDEIGKFSDAVRGVIERGKAERDEEKVRALLRGHRGRLPHEEGLPAYVVIRWETVHDSPRLPRFARRELKRFLLSLPVTYVYTLAALARVGRDGLRSATFVQQFDAVRRACARPQEALDAMLGKRRLAGDLEAALAELARAGIAVDSLV